MSCDDERDPVMELLEALAAERGFKLIPVKSAIRPALEVQLDHLAAELAQLPTTALVERAEALKHEDTRVYKLELEWNAAYDQRAKSIKSVDFPGITPAVRHEPRPTPQSIEVQRKEAAAAYQLARTILAKRVAVEALVEVVLRTAEPQPESPANPAA